jgi:hypothetical protein
MHPQGYIHTAPVGVGTGGVGSTSSFGGVGDTLGGMLGTGAIDPALTGLPAQGQLLDPPTLDPSVDLSGPDWFSLLFGTSTDPLALQPAPAFPPLHFQPPPLPPPTRFYVPPDFLPKHALHDQDDGLFGQGPGEMSRVLLRPDRRAEMMSDPAFLAPYFPNLYAAIAMSSVVPS